MAFPLSIFLVADEEMNPLDDGIERGLRFAPALEAALHAVPPHRRVDTKGGWTNPAHAP
jgi:hypothetical protein